nr:sugar ABC transporter permease [uncultured Sphaerochaeta sp.]
MKYSQKRINSIWYNPQVAAWVFLFPSLVSLMVFVFIPLLTAFLMSFFDVNIFLSSIKFSGFSNLKELAEDSRFWNSLKNTFQYTFLSVFIGTTFSLAMALYVSKNSIFRKLLRFSFYAPVVCSMTAMGIVWSILLDPTIGMIAKWTQMIGLPKMEFLKNPDMAMPLVVFVSIWKTFGSAMIIFIAALHAIPNVYYEAAVIDGAGVWIQFIRITLPQILPVLGFNVITSTIAGLMVFDQTYVMTRGGPLFRTETIVQYLYSRAFSISPFRLGYASSIAMILFFIIAVISVVLYRFFLKNENRVSGNE